MKEALEKEEDILKRRIEEEQVAKEAEEPRRKAEQDDLVKQLALENEQRIKQ